MKKIIRPLLYGIAMTALTYNMVVKELVDSAIDEKHCMWGYPDAPPYVAEPYCEESETISDFVEEHSITLDSIYALKLENRLSTCENNWKVHQSRPEYIVYQKEYDRCEKERDNYIRMSIERHNARDSQTVAFFEGLAGFILWAFGFMFGFTASNEKFLYNPLEEKTNSE